MLLVGMSKSSSGPPGTLEMLTQGSSPVNLVFECRAARKANADGKWQMADGRWQMADDEWQMTNDARLEIA